MEPREPGSMNPHLSSAKACCEALGKSPPARPLSACPRGGRDGSSMMRAICCHLSHHDPTDQGVNVLVTQYSPSLGQFYTL